MIIYRRIAAVLASSLVLLPATASAEEEVFSFEDFLENPRVYPVEEVAADVSYGFCPLYLTEQFPLTGNPLLAERGFGETVQTSHNDRFGEIEQVVAVLPDGAVAFGGASGQVCTTTVTGDNLEIVWAQLHKSMSYMGFDFQPDPENTGDRGTSKLETFKAPVEGQQLYLQLARTTEPTAVVAQLFVMAE